MFAETRHEVMAPVLSQTQGYSIGNAVTDKRFDGNALVPFAAGHSLISADLYAAVAAACDGEYWNATKGEPVSARHHSCRTKISITPYCSFAFPCSSLYLRSCVYP